MDHLTNHRAPAGVTKDVPLMCFKRIIKTRARNEIAVNYEEK